MPRINQNELAKAVTLREGKVQSLSIAQVKEVQKLTLEELAKLPEDDVTRLLNSIRKKLEQ